MILHGDCLKELEKIPDNSIDCLVTDPPYGMEFMGKEWDKSIPSIDIWKECLRVLKPGAFAFIMCIPRQDCLSRMLVSLEDAGFKTNFTSLYWTYATGFPKALNIGKKIDKKAGAVREVVGKKESRVAGFNNEVTYVDTERIDHNHITITAPSTPEAKKLEGSYGGFQPKPAVEVIIVVMKPLEKGKNYITQAMDNGKGIVWFDDCRIPYSDDKDLDSIINKKQAVFSIGWKTADIEFTSIEEYEGYKHNQEGRFPANLLVSDDVLDEKPKKKSEYERLVAAASKENHGISFMSEEKGTCPPPNSEGRFPANLLVSDDVLDDGKEHPTNDYHEFKVDAFASYNEVNRIDIERSKCIKSTNYSDSGSYSRFFSLDAWAEKNLPKELRRNRDIRINNKPFFGDDETKVDNGIVKEYNEQGRFPANLLVSDDVLDDGKADTGKTGPVRLKGKSNEGFHTMNIDSMGYVDSGNYSRFFSLDAWAEKNLPFLIVPKASKSEKNLGCEGLEDKKNEKKHDLNSYYYVCKKCNLKVEPAQGNENKCLCKDPELERVNISGKIIKNNHPTVKPIKLMSYLITLGSRPGDTILDPFAGSGTTGCSAIILGRKYILIERDEEYIKIIQARIKYYEENTLMEI